MTSLDVVSEGQNPEHITTGSHESHANPSHVSPALPPSFTTITTADFFQAAVTGAGIPIVGMDPTGLICSWNHTAARLFGRPESEVLGHPLEMLFAPEYRLTAARALQRTLHQRSVNLYEMAFVPPGAKNPLHVGVTLSCVLDAQNHPIGLVAWLRDISNRKELESNLLRTRHMASLGTLAAGVAHHFNNIVCGMSTMVEVAQSTEDPKAMHRALRMAAEAASRISYITQSLLAFSAQESGEPDLADLTEELLRFADAVEPTLNKKGITLVLDLQARRVAAVPRHRFSQVLHHLLRNAEEAFAELSPSAPPLGSPCSPTPISTSTTPPREKRITIRTLSQEEQIMMQFSDNAGGIPADNLPQVFDPFFTTKGVQGGGHKANPGLGLTLVHGVVMDMGGHIWADSLATQGATINILIPVVL